MKILYIMFAAIYSFLSSFILMLTVKQKPPYKWGDWPYAKNRVASWINCISNKTKYFKCRVDIFHYWGFVSFAALFFALVLLTIIDFSLDLSITNCFGNICLIFVLVGILLLPFLYEACLIIWWTILDKDNSKAKKIRDFNRMTKSHKKE